MTRREHDVLDFLEQWFLKNRASPSYQEICDGIGISSKANVYRLVHSLVRQGYISLESGQNRKRAIIPPDRDGLFRAAQSVIQNATLAPTGFFHVHPVDFQSLVQAVEKSKPKGEDHADHQP